jgi:hypothetical protein
MLARLVLAVVLVLAGCMPSTGGRLPKVVNWEPIENLPPPAILVVYSHRSIRNAAERAKADKRAGESWRKALNRVLATEPFLKHATIERDGDVRYVLFLDAVEHVNEDDAWLAGATLMLVPTTLRTKYEVFGTLVAASSLEELGVYTSSLSPEVMVWLPLLPLFPLALATMPRDHELLDETYRTVLAQVAQRIAERAEVDPPVPASSLRIGDEKPKAPVHRIERLQ